MTDNKHCCRWASFVREASFKQEISDKASKVDASGELDWYSLTVGWYMGKMGIDCDPNDAHEFALHIRYHTELG